MYVDIPYNDAALEKLIRNRESCPRLKRIAQARWDGYADCDLCPTRLHCMQEYDRVCDEGEDKPITRERVKETILTYKNLKTNFPNF